MKELPLPLISIIVPVHNKASYIKATIDSIKAQTPNNLEAIIINDSSTDNSEEIILTEIANDKRFRYEKVNFGNVALVRNYGFSLSQGLYICPLDGDDKIAPTFLETCIKAMQADGSIAIAYTGLWYIKPDGSEGLSEWPGEWNYDEQLKGKNQIPTCAVSKREVWERLGGQRSRYCANLGAGSEDAEFYLRAGAYGFKAKKVSNEGLFIYSWMSGIVTGAKDYTEINWREMHPWVTDQKHPFASYATPKRHSHAVSQYDQPAISIIIPVGPGHEKEVENALDSLEMQTFRKWEVVVIFDFDCWDKGTDERYTKFTPKIEQLKKSYPYARFVTYQEDGNNEASLGAGFARNFGAKLARAPLLFFLDADDVLAHSDALKLMLDAWNQQEGIIYSDYLGKAVWDYEAASKEFGANLLAYNAKKQTAVFRKKTVDFNPDLAQRQPELSSDPSMPYYHWCLISVLIPKAWHNEIGGFDESMTTWEDVDYHWRLARAGHCYYRIPEPLVMYAYHKGTRREKSAVTDENSLHAHKSMIQYIKRKYEGLEAKVCNCGSKKQPQTNGAKAVAGMNDSDWVEVEFDFPGSDTRSTYGKQLKSPTRQRLPNGQLVDYKGYSLSKGKRMLVLKADQKARPDMFRIVPNEVKVPEVEIKPLEEPRPLTEPDNIMQAIEPLIESIAAAQEIPTEAPKKRGRPKTKA